MSGECRNCGRTVSSRYICVFAPRHLESENEVRACPDCTSIRERGNIRTAKSNAGGQLDGDVA